MGWRNVRGKARACGEGVGCQAVTWALSLWQTKGLKACLKEDISSRLSLWICAPCGQVAAIPQGLGLLCSGKAMPTSSGCILARRVLASTQAILQTSRDNRLDSGKNERISWAPKAKVWTLPGSSTPILNAFGIRYPSSNESGSSISNEVPGSRVPVERAEEGDSNFALNESSCAARLLFHVSFGYYIKGRRSRPQQPFSIVTAFK